MSKGSDVTGTGCLMKQIFFCVLASWCMKKMTLGYVITRWLEWIMIEEYVLAGSAGWERYFQQLAVSAG